MSLGFTIFIPAYNRAHLLPRAFASIEAQTLRDFEVVIVDDGSTDATADVVAAWQARVSFPVRYLHQANQGKHVAHNAAVAAARGEFFVTLDSDDQLLPDALERLRRHWLDIPPEARAGYAGVEGLIAFGGRVPVRDRYPQDVLDTDHLTLRYRLGVTGDKKNALRTAVLRDHPYPVFPGERHLRPSIILKRIAHAYRTRHVNEVIQDCEYQPDGLSSDRNRLRMNNPQGMRRFYAEDLTLHRAWLDRRSRVRISLDYIRAALQAGAGFVAQGRELGWQPLWLALYPFGALRALHTRLRERVRPIKGAMPRPR
ncbi:glycosyltransferase involved in cell wall biosynthesis [Plasticicumulans lactativorans]|uniref:Glycosyltransferase involved in cell wall biosynthesis n=1 Tax=Plasticicumulans lactativorans TaxID=1133106 RepID=A0A4R2L8H7_9GAMM|nr:glycosyltransferase family 2 protein [Plasticicumulans lactativorans]TCO81616.1 glycosyltransferase involved in cell wall biosynthesis [Plasticicumulans lactativorans]